MPIMKFSDMPTGTWFTNGRERYFVKLQVHLKEGDEQQIHYLTSSNSEYLNDDEYYGIFNAISSEGVVMKFGYWQEFEVVPNPFPKTKKNRH
jgi:hypothetical protein